MKPKQAFNPPPNVGPPRGKRQAPPNAYHNNFPPQQQLPPGRNYYQAARHGPVAPVPPPPPSPPNSLPVGPPSSLPVGPVAPEGSKAQVDSDALPIAPPFSIPYYASPNYSFPQQNVPFYPNMSPKNQWPPQSQAYQQPAPSFPINFDWRSTLKVSAVKNQGQCGSCWAFSAMSALESQMLIQGVSLKYLSEQQLVDCDTNNFGCNGGDPEDAWRFLQNNGGAIPYSSYPYTSGISGNANPRCSVNKAKVYLQVKGYKDLVTDENSLKSSLLSYGPLAIGVDGTNWQLFSDGIMQCVNPQPDHAVLLIGLGVDSSGDPFWWVKNSWGSGWGEDGFVKVSRVPGHDCGITQSFAGYPMI